MDANAVLGHKTEKSGGDHADYTERLSNLTRLYHAKTFYLKALPIIKRAGGEDHPLYCARLLDLALFYYSIRSYANAEQLFSEILQILKKAGDEENPVYAGILTILADRYDSMGLYKEAELYFLQAKEIFKKLGEDNISYTDSLSKLARLYHSMGEYEKAEPLFKQALQIRKKVGGEDYAISLSDLARLYHSIGEYEKAEPLFKQALQIREKCGGEDYVTSLNDLAELYRTKCLYGDAKSYYLRALRVMSEVPGENHAEDYATSLNGLALLCKSIGSYVDAEDYYRKALAIRKKVLGEHHVGFASSLNNLAELYRIQGLYSDAEPLFLQAKDIYREKKGEGHPEYATNLNNLAMLYKSVGSYEKAKTCYLQALEIIKKFGENRADYAESLNNLARLYHSMGAYEDAEILYLQALPITKKVHGEDHPFYGDLLINLAVLYIATGRESEGLDRMKESLKIHDRMIGQVFSFAPEDQRLEYLSSVRTTIDLFISLVIQYYPQSPETILDALDLILRRKAITIEALAVQREVVLGGKYPDLKEQLTLLHMLKVSIAKKILAGPELEGKENHEEQLASWKALSEHLESLLVQNIPEMRLDFDLKKADRTAIARNLPPESVLLEFVYFDVYNFMAVPSRDESSWGPARYLVFILKSGEPDHVQMRELGEAAEIDPLILQFKAACSKPSMNYTIPGLALYKKVIEPILSHIGDIRSLFIAADGELNVLPFDALPMPEGGYMIDKYLIQYLSVGRDVLRFSATGSGEPGEPLVIAYPQYDLEQSDDEREQSEPIDQEDTGMTGISNRFGIDQARVPGRISRDIDCGKINFTPLFGAESEGIQVATLLNVEPFLGSDAVEGRIKNSSSPIILHIATHGIFLPNQKPDLNKDQSFMSGITSDKADLSRISRLENPLLRSFLALAGVNTWAKGGTLPPEAEDGLLNGEDVTGLDLTGTDLVVLSACETALGESKVGEGVFGLRRAFILAGARTLVISLWSVDDYSTCELMVEFYTRIQQGMPKAEALRKAKLTIRDDYPEPYFWGPFICQGDPGPLSCPKP